MRGGSVNNRGAMISGGLLALLVLGLAAPVSRLLKRFKLIES